MSFTDVVSNWYRWCLLRVYDILYRKNRKACLLSKEEVLDYAELTFLDAGEIQQVYEIFEDLGANFAVDKNPILEKEKVFCLPEFRMNPFTDRISKVFCESEDVISFDEFVNIISVFNYKTPSTMKVHYAFKMYDFNGDKLICAEDINELINRLKGSNPLKRRVYDQAVALIISYADIDGDCYLNEAEFENMIAKNREFSQTFTINI